MRKVFVECRGAGCRDDFIIRVAVVNDSGVQRGGHHVSRHFMPRCAALSLLRASPGSTLHVRPFDACASPLGLLGADESVQLAHSQYYREAEIVKGIATHICAHGSGDIPQFPRPASPSPTPVVDPLKLIRATSSKTAPQYSVLQEVFVSQPRALSGLRRLSPVRSRVLVRFPPRVNSLCLSCGSARSPRLSVFPSDRLRNLPRQKFTGCLLYAKAAREFAQAQVQFLGPQGFVGVGG